MHAQKEAQAAVTADICKCYEVLHKKKKKKKNQSSVCCLYRQIFKFHLSCIWLCEEPFFPKHPGFDSHSPDFNISNNSTTTEICANEEAGQRTVSFCIGAGGSGEKM